MDLRLDAYVVAGAENIVTPALLIYPRIVDENILATLRIAGNDPNRWRPHIKTVKSADVLSMLKLHGVVNLKCATTLELLLACESGAADVLLAFSVVGANARRTLEIAREFPRTRVSVLVETAAQIPFWMGTGLGVFVDVNPGMDRTGISQERIDEIAALANGAGSQFRGLHYYDGHVSAVNPVDREKQAHEGYDRLMRIVDAFSAQGIRMGEVITSGTPAAPCAMNYAPFRNAKFAHRISPGTVLFNDLNSLKQLPGFGYAPAAVILTTVVSQPTATSITCDAGHKSVSADSGVPTCAVIGHPELTPLKPSEEHLPIELNVAGSRLPAIGEQLYLLPKHICPSVNNFDKGVFVVDGRAGALTSIGARGHEMLVTIEA